MKKSKDTKQVNKYPPKLMRFSMIEIAEDTPCHHFELFQITYRLNFSTAFLEDFLKLLRKYK